MAEQSSHSKLHRISLSDALWIAISGSTLALTYASIFLVPIAIACGILWCITNLSGKTGMRLALLSSFFLYMSLSSFKWRIPPPIGIPITSEKAGRLKELLTRIAQLVGAPEANSLWLTPDATVGVYTEGYALLPIKRRTTASIGIVALDWLTVGELCSLLAHEFAHYSRLQPVLPRLISEAVLSLIRFVEGVRTQTALWWLNPTWWILRILTPLCALASFRLVQQSELRADAIAAMCCGSETFISALHKYALTKTLFDGVMREIIDRLALDRKSLTDIAKSFREFYINHIPPHTVEQIRSELLSIPSNPLQLYTSLSMRLATLGAATSHQRPLCALEEQNAPAHSLIADPQELSMELSQLYAAAVHRLFIPAHRIRRREASSNK